MSLTTIKAEFDSQIRRLAIDSSSVWSAVRSQILSSYSIDEKKHRAFTFHYVDEEGDLISVNSNGEFEEAVRCAKRLNKILKLTLIKVEQSADEEFTNDQKEKEKEKENLKVSAEQTSNDDEVKVEDDMNMNGVEQEEEIIWDGNNLPPRSPTLSDASDSSFVSINAQSLRDDDLQDNDEKHNDVVDVSQPLQAESFDDGSKGVVDDNNNIPGSPNQPELISGDSALVQNVMNQLDEDTIQLKVDTPKSLPSTTTGIVEEKELEPIIIDEPKEEMKDEKVECNEPTNRVQLPVMKVRNLRSVIETVINEKFLSWLDDLLSAVDDLDHSDEDIERVHQLTARIRLGLVNVTDNHKQIQQISDAVAKKMMRVMKLAEDKSPKSLTNSTFKSCKSDNTEKSSPPIPLSLTSQSSTNSPVSMSPSASASASSSSSSSSSSTSSFSDVIHRGISCDGCGMSPLHGVRFHCLTCDQIEKVRNAGGYDLCESCEAKGIHREVDGNIHVMIKFKQPTKFMVTIEGDKPISGHAVYDVMRVNDDGSRTPFMTPQPVVSLPNIKKNEAETSSSSASSSSSSSSSADESKASVVTLNKVDELESRIRALEGILRDGEQKKLEKKAEKERVRKLKEERKHAQLAMKNAKREAKKKQKEEKAAKAGKRKLKEIEEIEKKEENVEVKKDDSKEPINVKEEPKKETVETITVSNPTEKISTLPIVPIPIVASSATTAAPAPASAPSASAPSASTASVSSSNGSAPFAFTLPQFPFSNMVNSITNTVASSLSGPFAFGANSTNKPSAPSAPAVEPSPSTTATTVPILPIPALPLNSSASSSSSSSSSSVAVSTVSASSIWSSPNMNAKRSLADVRAPAFFPYISQLRDLEAMGFDVDRSINALRYYRGDVQKAINSML